MHSFSGYVSIYEPNLLIIVPRCRMAGVPQNHFPVVANTCPMSAQVGHWIRRHRLASFFLLAFAISWSLDGIVILLGMEPSWTRWIIIGILWGVWHLPLFFDPTAVHAQWPLSSQLSYFVGIIAFSILLGWVYNGSGGSILLVMVMHGAENVSGSLVPLELDRAIVKGVPDFVALAPMNVAHAVLMWVIALFVLVVFGRSLLASKLSTRTPGAANET